MNRRKLGSSRRNKGKRHAKDTENEPEAREDVEDNEGNKTLEVPTSAAARLEMQEELTRGTEHSISPSHDSLVVSPATTDYSEVENPTISPEYVMEALMPNTGDLQACKSEPNLERIEDYDCLDSEEIVSPCPVVDQQIINIQAANPSMNSEPDLESNKRDDTDLFRQDGSLEGVDLRTKNEAWINSAEKVETAFGQMYERESHWEDDVKHSVGQTLHQGVFAVEKFNLSLQTLPSEVNAPLYSQLQDSSLSVDEQTETGFGHFGNRRKLGSSRRNKGRQRVEECKEDILEKAKGVETLEKNNTSMEMRAPSQKDLYQDTEHEISSSVSPDSSMFSVFVPVESSAQTKCTETDRENFIPKSENLPEDQDERETDINVKVSDESEEAEQQDVDKYDIPHSEDSSSAHHSDDTAKEMQEDMVHPTQAQQIDYISETTIDNAAENPEIISGNHINQAEIINISQSELTEESTDDSATKQECSSLDKQNDFCSIERDLEAVDPRDEDDLVYGSRQIWTSDTENTKTAVGQMHEDESEAEDNVKLSPGQSVHSDKDSVLFEAESSIFSLENLPSELISNAQLQDSSLSVDEQTDTVRVEESEPEVLERTSVDKVPETTKIQSETKTTNQDELSQDTEHGIGLSVSHDNSMFSASAPSHSSEVEGSTPKTYPETEKENLILKSENLPEDQDERETDINVEVLNKSTEAMPQEVDKSDTRHSEWTKDADRSDDAVREEQKEDIHPTPVQEILHVDYSSETATDNAPENSEVISANLIDRAEIMNNYQSEFNNDNSATKQEISNPEEKPDEHLTKQDISEPLDLENDDHNLQCTNKPHISDLEKVDSAPSQVHEFKDKVEDDIKPITDPLFHQEKEGLLSETEIKPALSAFQTETTVSFDCQLEDSSDSVDAQNNTGFHQSSNRRKLGSSLRNNGKHKAKDSVTKTFHQTANEVDGNASSNTSSEVALTAETAGQEKSMEIILEVEKMNTSQTEEENVHFGTLVCTSELTTIGVHSTSAVDQRVIENSCCRQMPHEELPSVSLQTDTESEERHERTELLRQDGNLQENSVFEPHACPITPEIHTDPGQSVEKLSPEEEFPTKEEQLTDVSVAQQSEDAVRIEHGQEIEPAQTQGMFQIDHTTAKATVYSEISRNVVERIEIGDVDQSEAAVRNTDYPKPQIDDAERVQTALGDAYEIEGQVKDAMNPSDEGTDHHPSKEVFSEICDSEYSLQSLHCEMKAPLDSQLQQSYTSFNTGGNSGAPGSSQEKSMEIKLEEMDKSDTPHTENITLHDKEKAYFGTAAGISELTTSSPTVEQQPLKSNFRELPDDELPTVSSTTENKGKHEDTEMLRLFGNLEKNSTLQTQESDTDPPLDTQPLDNYQSFKDDTQSGLKPAGNRRKMGSSRRNKGRQEGKVILPKQELKEAVVENTVDDKVTEMSAANTMRQEELEELISVEKVNISSNVTGDENQEKLLEDTLYSHNVLENIVVATSDTNPSSDNDDSPKSNKDLNEKHTKHVKEPDNISHLTGYDTVKKDLTQSPQASVLEDDLDMQSSLYHDDIINLKSGTVHVSHQEEAQATGVLPCHSDSQQTDNVTETIDCVTVEDCSTEVESSMDVQGPEQDEGGEKGVHTAHKMENTSQEPDVDVSCKSGISTTKDEHNSLQEESQSDYGENMQVKSKQRRRKMGSSRRTPLNRKEEEAKDNTDETEESFINTEAGVRNLEEMEVGEELPLTAEVSPSENVQGTVEQQETDGNKTSHYDYKLKSSTSDKQSNESNVILALPPEQSTAVNPVTFHKVADERDERRNVDLSAEMSQQDDFTSTNLQITSDVAGSNDSSFSQLMPPNSETNSSITGGSSVSFCEVIQSTQSDRPESVKLVKVQDTDEQKPNNWNEGTHLEEKSPRPNLNSPNRRRKLGSTRKNLSSRTKREDLHQNQELENEATESVTATGDGTTESHPKMKEKDLQPDTEHKEGDSEKRKEKIIETMTISHVGESLLTPQAEQTAEESPISQSQSTESENQQTPSYLPSTSAKNDTVSQSASGGRRKKFGSSRKLNMMHQSNSQAGREAKIGAQNENVVRGITEDGANEEQSSGLRKISEVGESDEKATTSFSISEPVSKKTSTQPELSLAPGRQTQLSFAGSPRGTDYDVVMVGDSCVGKTSFMKRAQSGKFSLDLPASVGLDSCIWTVVVEGKPVMLQLWDTAGQERFRSITRQIFHKARAFLLMYDITSSQSFSAISYWANSIQEAAAENVTVLLLGNKSDHEQRRVKTQQGEILAKEYNFEFMECSAATGENVIEALETMARMLSQRADLREEATVLLKEPAQKKRSTCC